MWKWHVDKLSLLIIAIFSYAAILWFFYEHIVAVRLLTLLAAANGICLLFLALRFAWSIRTVYPKTMSVLFDIAIVTITTALTERGVDNQVINWLLVISGLAAGLHGIMVILNNFTIRRN